MGDLLGSSPRKRASEDKARWKGPVLVCGGSHQIRGVTGILGSPVHPPPLKRPSVLVGTPYWGEVGSDTNKCNTPRGTHAVEPPRDITSPLI